MLSPETAQPEWAHHDEVAIGDTLIADAGFTCLKAGDRRTVRGDAEGLFVLCKSERHYLDGQLNEAGRYVGFTKADGVPRLSPGQPAAESGAC
jgi:hypothetical protein